MSNLLKWSLIRSFSTLGHASRAQTLPLPQGGLRADLPSQVDVLYLDLFLCPLSMDQHFPCCWDTSCYLLHSFHFSTPAKLLLSCPPTCSGIVSIFLLNSLSLLPPPIHFLLVFELSQEFPLGQTWPPATFAWLPAYQRAVLLSVVFLGDQPSLLGPFASASNGILRSSSLNKPRSALPKFKISILLPAYLTSFRIFLPPSCDCCSQGCVQSSQPSEMFTLTSSS